MSKSKDIFKLHKIIQIPSSDLASPDHPTDFLRSLARYSHSEIKY